VPSGSAAAAKKATNAIPIVFLGEPDPVGTGLVETLARPGGNLTGLADAHADLVPKRLQFLKEVVPSVSRVGVLWNPANASSRDQVKTAHTAALALGLTVFPVAVKGPLPDDMDRAFATIAKQRLGGLLVVGDPTLGAQRKVIAERSIQHRLPASGPHRSWAESGLLLSYGADFIDLSRRSVAFAPGESGH
jgi:putative tryptophan/tyrosine transport system substrate-binding protein